jgi:methionine synthase I (cobalamin-dependent)
MTNHRLTGLLAGRRLFDGGYGWLLQERGLPPGVAAELWNVERSAAIEGLHEEYAAAGAQILTTNTFGGSRPRLEGHRLAERVVEINEAGARIARAVADRYDALVAGCVGPSGELLEPLGALTESDANEVFAEQIAGLATGGADLILIETMSDLGEASAAVKAAAKVAPELPVIVTMSFDTNLHTMMGVAPAQAFSAFADQEVDAIGANCGRGPEDMAQIAQALVSARAAALSVARGTSDIPLLAQSNAGLPRVSGAGFAYDVDPAGMARHAMELRGIGIDIVGACCGSAPDHVSAMAAALTSA